MLRIAECTDSFLPVFDGAGRVCYEYAQQLSLRGHECYVVTPAENAGYRGGYPFEIVDYTGVRLPRAMRPFVRSGVAALDVHYLRRIDSIAFDIVHAHGPGSAGQEAARIAARLRIPLIGTFHPRYFDDIYRYVTNPSLAEARVRAAAEFFTRCDEVWTVSAQAAELLQKAGFTGRIELMHNGTDLAQPAEADITRMRRALHVGDEPVLLYVGAPDFRKNFGLLLEAAASLKAGGARFQLLCLGRGPDESLARARAYALGLKGTARFLGQIVDDKDLTALYAHAKLCLFPSPHITAGLVVHEAAAVGTPCAVVEGSGAAEGIVAGVNGLVFPNDAAAYAAGVAEALSDPDALERIGQRARASIPKPWEQVINAVEARYLALSERERYALKRKRGLFRKELAAVDETLGKRALDMMYRLVRQDMQNVYCYHARPQRPKRLPERAHVPLPRATPESQGVSSEALRSFYAAIDADPVAGAHAVMVLRHGNVIAEGVWTPYDRQLPHQLFSLSKSVTATAIGMLWDAGKLDLDERLCDIFADKAPEDTQRPAYRLTVRHLLTMSTGSEFNELGTLLDPDWEKAFLQAGVKFGPGERFDYNSLNTYMLAAIVRRRSGMGVSEYLHTRLFVPLGIRQAPWELCPMGTEKGGWGLSLTLESVAKIGQLYLNGGTWPVNGQEKRLISRAWVEMAAGCQIETPNGECKSGYGYQIWMLERPGGFLFNGMFGQFMLCMPDLDMVIAILSGSPELYGQSNMDRHVADAFSNLSDQPLTCDPAAHAALGRTLAELTCMHRLPRVTPGALPGSFSALRTELSGRVYSFSPNAAGLFPAMLSGLTDSFTTGLAHAVFRTGEDGSLVVEFDEGRARNELCVAEGRYTRGTVSLKGLVHEVAATACAERLENGEWILSLFVHFLETPFTRVLKFYLQDDGVTFIADEQPSLQDAIGMLLEIVSMSRTELARGLLPLLRAESLQSRLRTFTTFTAQGRL